MSGHIHGKAVVDAMPGRRGRYARDMNSFSS